MIEWSDEQQMVRAAVRDFIEKEVVPHHRELEHGDLPPYDILRKLFRTFGMDAMARDRFDAPDRPRQGGRGRRGRGPGVGRRAGRPARPGARPPTPPRSR